MGFLVSGLGIGVTALLWVLGAGWGCATRPATMGRVILEATQPALVIFTNAAAWERVSPEGGAGAVELTSPEIATVTPWNELVVSWNVEPAEGAGLELEAEARVGERWTRRYRLGGWSLDGEQPVVRSSVNGESDEDGVVKTDTLVMKSAANGVRIRLRLTGTVAVERERLRWVTVSLCDTGAQPEARGPERSVWGRTLEVPERSQVSYLDGRAWCSPTSVSMILAWWAEELKRPELKRDVPEVARGVNDPGWPGTGNWPFNTAYAGSFSGIRGCAARLRDLRDLEELVGAGIPVVLSVNAPALRGKPLARDTGHLILCVGFTPEGDVVANDPWARLEEGQRVRRVYLRGNVDRAWSSSHRLAYLIAPVGRADRFPAAWR